MRVFYTTPHSHQTKIQCPPLTPEGEERRSILFTFLFPSPSKKVKSDFPYYSFGTTPPSKSIITPLKRRRQYLQRQRCRHPRPRTTCDCISPPYTRTSSTHPRPLPSSPPSTRSHPPSPNAGVRMGFSSGNSCYKCIFMVLCRIFSPKRPTNKCVVGGGGIKLTPLMI